MSPETAELTKYASNAFLATKVTFINEVADLCEAVDADVQMVAKSLGRDGRIGPKFLHAGPGFGGSCFPKDTRAFASIGRRYGAGQRIIESVIRVNDARKRRMVDRVVRACGGSLQGKAIAVLGLTFKPNTDDLRESVSLDLIPALLARGAAVRTFDPAGMPHARRLLDARVTFCHDAYEAATGAAAVVILTEWNQFRSLDFVRLTEVMRERVLVDLRNVYRPEDVAAAGFIYHSIGRGSVRPAPVEVG
jgi:UDPglucose 6-dehydrogenase